MKAYQSALLMSGTCLLAGALVAACGGDEEGTAPAGTSPGTADASTTPPVETPVGDFTLSVDPSAIAAPNGTQSTVKVTLARSGGAGDVALSMTDLPAGVTAVFAPAQLSGNDTESDLTISIGNDAALGAAKLTVVGRSGDKEHTASIDLTVQTITVSGTLASSSTGVEVGLVGKPSIFTGAGGTFTFTDVKVPYDLYSVAHTDISGLPKSDDVSYYRGLTRTDPTIEAPMGKVGVLPPGNTATISGTLSGTAVPIDASHPVMLVWNGSRNAPVLLSSGGLAYSFTRSWQGLTAGKQSGTVYAIQFDGSAQKLTGYGEFAVAVANGESATANVTMTAGAEAKGTGTVTVPVGFPAPSIGPFMYFGGRRYAANTPYTVAQPMNLLIPVVPSGPTTYEFSSTLGGAKTEVSFSGLEADTDLTYALQAPPTFVAPAAGAGGINATAAFSWTAPPDAVSLVRWTVGQVTYRLFTTGTQATIPVIPEQSVGSTNNGAWDLEVYGPMTSVNDLTGPKGRDLEAAPIRYHASSDGSRPFVWAP